MNTIYKQIRGGSWIGNANLAHAMARNDDYNSNLRTTNVGFRVIKTPKTKYKQIRSGSWFSFKYYCLPNFRYKISPNGRYDDLLGFRVTKLNNTRNKQTEKHKQL